MSADGNRSTDYADVEAGIPPPVDDPAESASYRVTSLEQTRSQPSTDRHAGSLMQHESLEERQASLDQSRRQRSEGAAAALTELAEPRPVDIPAADTDEKNNTSALKDRQQAGVGRRSELATRIYTLTYLIFFSILGTLARLGLTALTQYAGAPVLNGVVWANFAGSLIMGFLAEDRNLFAPDYGKQDTDQIRAQGNKPSDDAIAQSKKQHASIKKTIPLFVGLSTGFCGSFTSFSAFQRDVFLALANASTLGDVGASSRSPGQSFLALLAALILTPCLSLAALQLGAHIALALEVLTPTLPVRFLRRILDPLAIPLAAGCWLGALFLVIWPPDRPTGPSPSGPYWADESWRGEVLFAILFAPPGCIARFYVSLWLNGRRPAFPLGTFTVNMIGTVVEALCFDLQHAPLSAAGGAVGGGLVGSQVLNGVMDGFCGCLTTVSTWVAELKSLRRRHAYIYGSATLAGGLAIVVVVMGSLKWTDGLATA